MNGLSKIASDSRRTSMVCPHLSVRCLLLVLATAFMATGCHLLYRPHWSQFRALCEDPGRNFIARKVTADGYLREGLSCSEDWRYLLDHGLKFCESHEGVGSAKGYYKYSIADSDAAGCQEFRVYGPESQRGPYRDRTQGKCLLKQRIEQPESRYKLVFEQGVVEDDGRHFVTASKDDRRGLGTIGFSRHRIVNLADGEVLAQKIQYSWVLVGASSAPAPAPVMCSPFARAEPITGFLLQAISETEDPVR